MEYIEAARTVRLLSHHKTYLAADPDYGEDSVRLVRGGAAGQAARWIVERATSTPGLFRLRSSTGRYLAASDKRFLLGSTGRRVVLLPHPDPSAEWRPLRDGKRLKLQTRSGTFLRGNGGMKPYSGAVTHDIPHRTFTQEWVLWHLDVLELRDPPPGGLTTTMTGTRPGPASWLREEGLRSTSTSSSVRDLAESDSSPGEDEDDVSVSESESGSLPSSPVRPTSFGLWKGSSMGNQGTKIIYYIVDDKGGVDEDNQSSFTFQGSSVEDLTRKLEELTGIQGLIPCIRDVLNDRLLRLRLNLPPNRRTVTVVAVPSSSPVARRLDL